MMGTRVRSLKDLKAALRNSALVKGLELSRVDQHAEAVALFETIKDFSSLDAESKSLVKISYCTCGKVSQHEGDFGKAHRGFSKAREVCPDDVLLIERMKLLASHRKYQTRENIGEFRRHLGFGVTSGGFEKYEYPFLQIAKDKGILEQPPIESGSKLIEAIETVGRYRIQAQGRHLLSHRIREYKGRHPFGSANASLALPFAWLLADFVKSNTEFGRLVDVIVPSPSNPENYLARGFVPSILIGQELSRCLAIPYRELFLVTPMQCRFRDMSYPEAKKLVRFRDRRCDKIISGNQVLLLDDVITSGRTLTLLADMLKWAGATAVYGIAIAKT